MTNTSSKLTSLFSWNKTREMAPRGCFLDLDTASSSPGKGGDDLSYTSLRDLLPASRPGSPVKQARPSEEKYDEGEVDRLPIKNRLVEQAARAYLLPVSPQKTPPEQFFAHYWAKLTSSSTSESSVCIHGCTHGCLSCLPALLWVDLTHVMHALFAQLRPPQALISDHRRGAYHPKPLRRSTTTPAPSLVTPLVK